MRTRAGEAEGEVEREREREREGGVMWSELGRGGVGGEGRTTESAPRARE